MRRIRSSGFTLVELVVSITLIGILAVAAVPMLRLPMTAYLDANRRADLASALDLTVGKIGSDLAQALPNSIRVRQVGARYFLEYLEVRASGRYRSGPSLAPQSCPAICTLPAGNDMLEFACPESCFTTLGPLQGNAPVPGADYVVVNPLGPGIPGGDPYFGGAALPPGGIKSVLQSVAAVAGGSRITMTPHAFPAGPASRQFYVVATPVSYECNPATQRLTRYWGYPVAAVQPVAFAAAQAAPLATAVAACTFRYTATGGVGRGGVVSLWLRFTQAAAGLAGAESVDAFTQFSVREQP